MKAGSRLLVRAALGVLIASAMGCGKGETSTSAVDAGARGPRIVRLDPGVVDRLGVKVEGAGGQGKVHQIQVPGSLDFDVEKVARIGTVLEGRVTGVSAKVGDRVKKGQRVLTLIAPAVAAAQADYLSARAEARFSGDRVKREEGLASQSLTTAQELGLARSAKEKADAHVAAAEARLRAMSVGIPENQERIAAAGSVTLVSPMDGVVVERTVVVGDYLSPHENAIVVADLTELWATLEVFEGDMPYMRLGAPVTLTLDAIPGKEFPGKLAALEPHLGRASRSVRARVTVPNPEATLRPGFFVRASILIPEEGGLLLVPASAVQPLDDDDVVFVEREKGVYEIRLVRVARRTAEIAEIDEGLARGERIVVQGAFLLRGEVTRQ